MILALRLAWRELRRGAPGLRIVLACLALGVAAIAGVGSLREGVERGLAADGRRILGGDFEIDTGAQPLPAAARAWLTAHGARLSAIVRMRSMLIAPSGERMLVDLKAVDPAWPLVGAAGLRPAGPLAAALAAEGGAEGGGFFGLLAQPLVLDRLGLHVGDTVRLGRASFTLRGALTDEPDRVATASIFGPRVLIAAAALPATGLVQPGSMLEHGLRAVLVEGADPAATVRALRAAFPDQGWRIRLSGDALPGARRFIDQNGLFMTLVGLTALLVGGIGVANGVRAWLEARAQSLAVLRCIGAPGRLVFQVCLVQVMALAAAGVLAGLAVGAALPALARALLADLLPVPPRLGLYPGPLALAAAYGLLTAACFALLPLGRTLSIPAAALFRDALLPAPGRPGRRLLAAVLGLAAALVALTVATAPDRGFALWFCAGALATLAVFRLGALAVERLARLAPRLASPAARLGLANLHRPGAPTAQMLVSLGLGLSTLATVALIEGNMRQQIVRDIPANAPSFYFVDIQPDEVARFDAILRASPGVTKVDEVPSLRARLVSVAGVPAERVRAAPGTEWALRGDRGLTYAAAPPPGTHLVAGAWWPPDYAGPPLVSFDAGLARGWGVHVGDVLRVNVLGRDLDLRVASLREIDWRSLALNFALVASPGALAGAPAAYIAAVKVAPEQAGALLRTVTDALPNVTGISVTDVLDAIAALLGQLGAALGATGTLTLAAGALVLAGAVAAGQRRRVQEAVILRALGARRGQILLAWLVEFGTLGAAAGVIAALVGVVASLGVMHFVLHAEWSFLPGVLAATLLGAMALMLALGYAATARALAAKAGPMLRNE